eukprot:TRINITY_DN4519_c0_g1_i2.p1 TRINITY_DN4519_c0_g1~~TRINITY_DN4519_c0_g1_i2.p1  ORF type:complete len:303 (+),score=41.73 TRINITY_DN4519_c0_g1_i2:48-956(+)
MPRHLIVFGGTGVLGRGVCREALNREWDVTVVSRRIKGREGVTYCGWEGWEQHLKEGSVLVNLAGENPGKGYWTQGLRNKILESRLNAIEAIKRGVENSIEKPALLIQASAAGVYGNTGDTLVTEDMDGGVLPSHHIEGGRFRVEVCKKIEETLNTVPVPSVALRIGHPVISEDGLLGPLNLASMLGVASLGDGEQYLPWVHLDDLSRSIFHVTETPSLHGRPVNVSSPSPVTNRDFLSVLSKLRGRPYAILPIPSLFLSILGPSSCVVLDSVRQHPQNLLDTGFKFKHDSLEGALKAYYKL